jgi:formylglycine-generating enzyme required for sulfatase activity
MGSDRFYPEETPRRRARVDGFWIDETPVTNAEFRAFVDATGYRTWAESAPDPADYPGMPAEMAHAGSLVFEKTAGPVPLDGFAHWWHFAFGANWRRPRGPDSSIEGLEDHPVVHIAYGDAEVYAEWAGKSLPSEAEWEYAARGGLMTEFAWGDELAPGGRMLANYWQGNFPYDNTRLDGWERTSPVRSYPPNGFGLFDMIGNVWEWTADWFRVAAVASRPCCAPSRGPASAEEQSRESPNDRFGRKVIKGGSHLCAPNYCQRYRPAARYPQTVDTSTSHIGFRCVRRGTSSPPAR